jgi:hypothetical protein
MGEIISMRIEQFREWLAFKIHPEMRIYIQVAKIMGELNENEKIVKTIEQSSLRNKKAVIDLVETKYFPLNDIIERLDDASEDQTSSDAS